MGGRDENPQALDVVVGFCFLCARFHPNLRPGKVLAGAGSLFRAPGGSRQRPPAALSFRPGEHQVVWPRVLQNILA